MTFPGQSTTRLLGRTFWGILGLAFLVLVTGCPETKEAVPAVEGWPPKTPLSSSRVQPAAGDATARAIADPGKKKGAQPGKVPTLSSCQRLVERACGLLGEYSQECAQARGNVRRPKRRELQMECDEIVKIFEATHARDTRRNPCYVLARRVCTSRGKDSRECRDRKESTKRLTKPEQRRACRGDLLLEEARFILDPGA